MKVANLSCCVVISDGTLLRFMLLNIIYTGIFVCNFILRSLMAQHQSIHILGSPYILGVLAADTFIVVQTNFHSIV